MNFVNL